MPQAAQNQVPAATREVLPKAKPTRTPVGQPEPESKGIDTEQDVDFVAMRVNQLVGQMQAMIVEDNQLRGRVQRLEEVGRGRWIPPPSEIAEPEEEAEPDKRTRM